jgi:2,3-bisphosphoglycerate-independent phosphoglycerate mutase
MYKGLSQMLGMSIAPTGDTFGDQLATLKDQWGNHDFFFVHYKPTDSAGEDGNFTEKVNALENLDQQLPEILDLDPDVLVVAGDHSTPSVLARHSWHPVPFLIHSAMNQSGETEKFTEREARKGALGTIQATDLMALALAHSGKLEKFGA